MCSFLEKQLNYVEDHHEYSLASEEVAQENSSANSGVVDAGRQFSY